MLKPTLSIDSSDIRAMNKQLRATEPDLLKMFRKEIRQIAKPINQQIKANIPANAPMSGMAKGNGRLTWFGSKIPKSTSVQNRVKPSGRSLTTALVAIKLNSAAVSMADMAGRTMSSATRSREYTIRLRNGELRKRRHRINGQGKHMIRELGGRASRYGWPALENKMGAVEREIDAVIEKYYFIANAGK